MIEYHTIKVSQNTTERTFMHHITLKIGVLMGGLSIEREVSFNSGRTICDHLDTNLYTVIPLFQTEDNRLFILPWKFLHRGKISDFASKLSQEAQELLWDDLKQEVDFIYIAQHGRYAEDGTLQGLLEVLKIPYFGSKIAGSALGMNKILQKKILKAHGITVAKDLIVKPSELIFYKNAQEDLFLKLSKKNISYPLIVKPSHEGSSFGVSLVKKESELLAALAYACFIHDAKGQPVLLEEYVEGMEFTCTLLIHPKTKAVTFFPPTEIVHTHQAEIHTFEQKYMPGHSQKFTPARCSLENLKKIQETCLKAAQALSITTVARIDGFLKADGTIVIIDPNTLCGMAPSSFFFNQAAYQGMGHSALINHLIKMELEGYDMNAIKIEKQNADEKHQKIRVAVLLGGPSLEKETSLDSGRNVCYKLSREKYDVIPLFVDAKTELYPLSEKLLVHNSTAEIEHELDRSTKILWHDLPRICDFVFIALHGIPGENGAMQGLLEMFKLPYNGSGIATSALCMDKYKTNEFLKAQGFSVPESILIFKEDWLQNKDLFFTKIEKICGFPAIVKPHDDGCSVMVQKIKNKNQIIDAVETIFKNKKDYALVESWIPGMELTVGVLGNDTPQALPPSQALSSGDILSIEEKFLPGAGENQTPAPLPSETLLLIQETVKNAFIALECSGYARIDCFYQSAAVSPTGKERVVILEVNNLPGLTPATCIFHQAAEIGIKPMEFLDTIIELGFEKHQKNYQN